MLKISVIIPARNEACYLEACLLALKQQTHKPLEVIVVDNASSDDTAEIATRMGARVLREPQTGIVYARNRGFNAARGHIIARIDADTVVPHNWTQQLSAVFANTDTKAVSGPALFYDVPLPRLFSTAYHNIVFSFNRLLLGHHILWGSNMALRRTVWQQAKRLTANSNKYHEDLDLGLSINSLGHQTTFLPSLTVLASMRSLYRSHTYFKRYINRWYATLRGHGFRGYGLDHAVGMLIICLQPLTAKVCRHYLAFKFHFRQQLWFGHPDQSAPAGSHSIDP